MRAFFWFVLTAVHLFAVDASLTIETDVEQRARVAVLDASDTESRKVFRLFLSDLTVSGHFLADDTYRRDVSLGGIRDASLKGKEYLVVYRYTQTNGAKLDVKLLKASDGTELFAKRYGVAQRAKMPFLVHKAVYDINKVLRFPDISWINRYVLVARYTAPRKTDIAVADYTFSYRKSVIRGGLNLFPKWADKAQHAFYYTSYNSGVPTLYKLDLYTGRRVRIVSSEGMLVCSDVSDDGTRLLLTMAPSGQPDIYELNVRTGAKRRLTRFGGIDVGAKYAEGERSIVFVSNRLGYPNIYKKRIGSSAVSQVVYRGRNNNACDAFDTKVVYASRESRAVFGNNTFNIYLTSTDDPTTRPLTTTGSNQFPRFSTDGNVVMYIKQRGGASSVGYVNLQSGRTLLFPFDGHKLQSIDW